MYLSLSIYIYVYASSVAPDWCTRVRMHALRQANVHACAHINYRTRKRPQGHTKQNRSASCVPVMHVA